MAARMRLLYVDRAYSNEGNRDKYFVVLYGLEQEYDVEADFDLSERTVALVKQALNPFAAIVTHVPFDDRPPLYERSLDVLHELRVMVDIPKPACMAGLRYLRRPCPKLKKPWRMILPLPSWPKKSQARLAQRALSIQASG